jgi:hypothetical protein
MPPIMSTLSTVQQVGQAVSHILQEANPAVLKRWVKGQVGFVNCQKLKNATQPIIDNFKTLHANHAVNPEVKGLFNSAEEFLKPIATKLGMTPERFDELATAAKHFVTTLLRLPEDFSKADLNNASEDLTKDVIAGVGRLQAKVLGYLKKTPPDIQHLANDVATAGKTIGE